MPCNCHFFFFLEKHFLKYSFSPSFYKIIHDLSKIASYLIKLKMLVYLIADFIYTKMLLIEIILSFSFYFTLFLFSSVQFSPSVMSDSLRPHELQHARPPCPSPTPGVHADSRPSSQ